MTSPSPKGERGLSWSAKYGYLGAEAFSEVLLDGMNDVYTGMRPAQLVVPAGYFNLRA